MSTAPSAGADTFGAFYRDRRVMITGGLGFIGSNLARQLAGLGARVLIVDSLISEYGGNLFNIRGIEDRVTVNIADIRQQSTMNYLVREQDVIGPVRVIDVLVNVDDRFGSAGRRGAASERGPGERETGRGKKFAA